MSRKLISNSEEETQEAGARFARSLNQGGVVALEGTLGTGKTIFVKGMAVGLGVVDTVQSPTFVLMNIYDIHHPHITTLVHVDCYRFDKPEDALAIGLQDYTEDKRTLVVIEWAEKIQELLPENTQRIAFSVGQNESRTVTFL